MARSKKADAIQIINNETEEIREVNIYDLTRDAYLTFGRYVNNWRQLPQIIDGLKISYRRLLYSALTYPQGKLVKSVMLLGKMAECFPGDTEILDVNGNKFSILEINDKLNKGESVYTFSCDKDGNPNVTKIIDVFDKGVVNDLVKVTLDNGEHFICTPDHKIMLRTGLFMKAKDLKEGSSLMPIYLDIKPCHNMTRRVSKVENIHSEQGVRVYDLSVDDDSHNFTLGVGVQVHNCHPHNCESSYNVVCSYVHSGIFDMQGFPGCSSISGQSSPAAAPRYTEVKVSDNYYSILGRLIKKVPYVESPVGPLEPTYIPTPLPISLILENVSGIGLGIATDLPNFSAKSMYQAFINDDPSLLEPNIDIEMDKSKSELNKLWNEGKGKVCYYYKVSPIKGPDGNPGFLIEGDAGIFTPKLKRIKDWQSEGKVYIEDMITQDGAKLAIYKVPNIKSLSTDELGAEVNKVCVNSNTYNLNVSDGGSAFRIPLREWIKATYTNYINLVTQDNLENIEACKFDIQVYSNIEQVANYIINENPKAENEEIAEKCNISIDVVNAIMSRTISNLRKTKDQTEKVKSLKAKLKELKAFDAVKFTEEIVNKL